MSESIALGANESFDSNETTVSAGSSSTQTYGWILHPVIDTLFCCGGLVWALFAFHFFVVKPLNNPALTQLMVLLTVLITHCFGETHTVATLVRAYRNADTRRRYAAYTHWAALACASVGLVGLFVPGVTPILAKIYLLWVVQHFTAQTYGLVLLYCFKNKYTLHKIEKRVIWALMNCTAAYALVRQFSFQEWTGNGFLGLELPKLPLLPPVVFEVATITLELAVVAMVLMVVRKAIVERKVMPLPAMMLLSTGVMIFAVGREVAGILWVYVPALFHGSQYVAISGAHYLKEHKQAEGLPASKLVTLLMQASGVRYLGFLLLGAVFIYVGLPRLIQEVGFDYTLAFATVFVLVNLHHFVTDQAIWKLRDPKLRQSLSSG